MDRTARSGWSQTVIPFEVFAIVRLTATFLFHFAALLSFVVPPNPDSPFARRRRRRRRLLFRSPLR